MTAPYHILSSSLLTDHSTQHGQSLRSLLFWDVAPRQWVTGAQRYEVAWWPHLRDRNAREEPSR